MLSLIRGTDLFATPVELSYKGQRAFKTVLGGICSIVLIVVVALSFAINVWKLMT